MRIGFIGAGKVGFSLGKFFAQGSVPMTGYFSRHGESAVCAAKFTGTKHYDRIEDLVSDSDAIFITVPDKAVSSVYEEIKELNISGKQLCHCSGAMTAEDAFPDIEKTGAYGYSIHPLFPVSSKYTAYKELSGAFFCLEGNEKHLPEWEKLLNNLGCKVRIIDKGAKVKYHTACAMASNLVCALVQQSVELLLECGFTESEAVSAISPLLYSNIEHIAEGSPTEALTGPIERNDAETVKKHLNCLNGTKALEIYRVLSKKLVDMAAKKHPEEVYDDLKNLFI